METPAKLMSGIEKLRKLVEVKKQVQKEAKEVYHRNADVQALVDKQKKRNAERFATH